jgi:hypothetical protein
MNDSELDVLLGTPLPERDAGEFSVALMEAVARHQARPARILAWIMIGVLTCVIAAAMVYGALVAGHASLSAQPFAIPAVLVFLALLLSYAVMQSARE